jgi:hypothetical protein
MEQIMKRKTTKLLNKRLQGGLSVYIMFMLGLSIMLYMFGFTNMLGTGITGDSGYRSTASTDSTNANTSIENPNMQTEANPLKFALEQVLSFTKENPLLVIGGVAGVIAMGIGSFLLGANMSVFYQYIIPIGFLIIFLNYAVFPINPGSADLARLQLAPHLSIATVLFIFFNLWFMIGIIQYVRNGEF